MENLARINRLKIDYGNVTAVKDVSFEVNVGEIIAIIGPNGSGKTSIVECLEGLRKTTSGNIQIFGKDPFENRKEIYKYMGVQLQESSYPDRMKVEEICQWASSFYENSVEYKKLLEHLDLFEKRKRYINKLSGGEKQRLSILLALLARPKLLILDELTTGLDPEVRRNIWEILKMIRKSGVGILLVSHYMEEVEYLADRIVFINHGSHLFTGTLDELASFAEKNLPAEYLKFNMTLEDIYLAFSPKQETLSLEGIL